MSNKFLLKNGIQANKRHQNKDIHQKMMGAVTRKNKIMKWMKVRRSKRKREVGDSRRSKRRDIRVETHQSRLRIKVLLRSPRTFFKINWKTRSS